jgi:hypothetical protein
MSLEVTGMKDLIAQLRADLRPITRAGALAYALEVHDEVAPYPAAPSSAGRRQWYERGYGRRWRRRDGSIGGRKTSQTLGRRWAVRPTPDGAEVANTASYAPLVHGTKTQARIHAQRGWVTVGTAAGNVKRSDAPDRLFGQPIRAALAGRRP